MLAQRCARGLASLYAQANLFDLQAKYAEVVSLATARRYLSGLPALQCAAP